MSTRRLFLRGALGGAGLVMVEMTSPTPQGRITPACTGLWNDDQMAGFKRIVDFVHAQGDARIGIQLGHHLPGRHVIALVRQHLGQTPGHLGGHIHQQRMLAQPAHTLQPQPVLQALEGLLDAPAPVIQVGQLSHRCHVLGQGGQQHSCAPTGADVAYQTGMHARGPVQLPGLRLLRIARPQPAPALAVAAAQELARSAPAVSTVAADDKVDATLEQRLHQPGGRVAPIQDQHIAPAQPIELVKKHLALALGLGADGHVKHQIIARQVQAQGALNRGGQRAGAQAGALGRREYRAIGANQPTALEEMQLALSLYAAEQTLIECPQGRHMQPGTGLGQGAVRDQNIGADSPQAGEEGVKRALDAATAKAQQGRQECGQWQLARAGEGVGMIGTAGQIGKGRAVQVIAKIGQKRLCKFTVLRQKSCQPQKKIKQNQRLADCSSLSSVDCAQHLATT